MSSFKRKSSAKHASTETGAKLSLASPLTHLTSTGIPSLDDILGGGLPLSCTLLIIAPDPYSSYGELVQKYFVAQSLKAGHHLIVVAENAEEFVKDIMWTPTSTNTPDEVPNIPDDVEDPNEVHEIKIAWRYEQMKSFQTTISSESLPESASDFCHHFHLSHTISVPELEGYIQSGHLSYISAQTEWMSEEEPLTCRILRQIMTFLKKHESKILSSRSPIRICVPSLGCPWWGELSDHSILHFLHSLRSLTRQYTHSCASVSLSSHISTEHYGGWGWIQKLCWMSDAALSMSAFSVDPSLKAAFPSYHGLLQIHKLPAPHTLLPPSDKLSTLRGLSAVAGVKGGSENNLAFKSTRKRLVFETLHLDIEGGVGERRTTAPPAIGEDKPPDSVTDHAGLITRSKVSRPALGIEVEDLPVEEMNADPNDNCGRTINIKASKQKKMKKQVAFRADQYDF